MLVVPPELVAAVLCTQGLAVVLNVLEERVVLGGSPQPCCPPQQLVLRRISVRVRLSSAMLPSMEVLFLSPNTHFDTFLWGVGVQHKKHEQ